jgi:hypothetical protein
VFPGIAHVSKMSLNESGDESERLMTYTKDRPSDPGFYWVKVLSSEGRRFETVVKVSWGSRVGERGPGTSSPKPENVFWDGETVTVHDERLLEFAGPIPTPER